MVLRVLNHILEVSYLGKSLKSQIGSRLDLLAKISIPYRKELCKVCRYQNPAFICLQYVFLCLYGFFIAAPMSFSNSFQRFIFHL